MNFMLSITAERPARNYAVHSTPYKYLSKRLEVPTKTDPSYALNFIFKHTMQPGLVANAYQLLCNEAEIIKL